LCGERRSRGLVGCGNLLVNLLMYLHRAIWGLDHELAVWLPCLPLLALLDLHLPSHKVLAILLAHACADHRVDSPRLLALARSLAALALQTGPCAQLLVRWRVLDAAAVLLDEELSEQHHACELALRFG
jgi:hypothetical protein